MLTDRNRHGERRAQELQHLLEQQAELDRATFLFVLTADREDLLHQFLGPLPSREHTLQTMPRRTLVWHLVYDKFRIAQNRREHVIEIVGNTTSQGSQG